MLRSEVDEVVRQQAEVGIDYISDGELGNASGDGGFAQGAGIQRQVPSIMWAKLQALVEGAQLASRQLAVV